IGPVQRQIPAHTGVADDKVRPQLAAVGEAGRDGPQPRWRETTGPGQEAADSVADRLPRGADSQAAIQPRAGLSPLLGAARRDNGSRHTTLPLAAAIIIRLVSGPA